MALINETDIIIFDILKFILHFYSSHQAPSVRKIPYPFYPIEISLSPQLIFYNIHLPLYNVTLDFYLRLYTCDQRPLLSVF